MKYHVERSTFINAKLEKVRPYIEDFKQWNRWSPWTIAEPTCEMSFEGKAGEVGHQMSWNGEIIGSGINTVEALEGNTIYYNLQFLKPFKSKAKTSFIMEAEGDGTRVTWTMDSSLPFFMFFMVGTMKGWIEMDYDRGLKMLKEVAEKGTVDADTTNEGVKTFEGFGYVGIQKTSHMDDMGKEMQVCFDKLAKDLEAKGKKAKHWVSLYPKFNMKTKMFTYIAAASNEEVGDTNLGSEYVTGEIETRQMFEIKHRGSYDFLGNAWSMGMMFLRAKKMKQKGIPFEYYWNNPSEVKEEKLETSIFFPLK